MLHRYQYSLYYYYQAASLRPSDARMWTALGNGLLHLNCLLPARLAYERAVFHCTGDTEGIATRDLARLYREEANSGVVAPTCLSDAAKTYYLYLVISNQNNQQNIWNIVIPQNNVANKDNKADTINDKEIQVFPPTSFESFLSRMNYHAQQLANNNPNNNQPMVIQNLDDSIFFSSNDSHFHQDAANHLPSGILDAEQAEALWFLASYCHSIHETLSAQYFCSKYVRTFLFY
jgi:hypothetical protein